MTYEEALRFIRQTESMGSRMGLERIRELTERLGNPQKGLKFIHVAGTNGKGSVCAMTAEILKEAGYRVGMFTSPELFGFETQFLVNGRPISKENLIALAESMKPAVDAMEDKPSEFEIITALAFLYFRRCACDYVVLEVGMGGIDDSTNVIDAPEIAVIVNIGLDHMQFLGNTVEEIAEKKAGIIKTGCTTVLADQTQEVMDVIREDCRKKGCPVVESDNSMMKSLNRLSCEIPGGEAVDKNEEATSGTGEFAGLPVVQYLDYKNYHELALSLLGQYQKKNAAIVLEVIEVLKSKGALIPEAAVRAGMLNVRWPGRFEILRRDPLFIVDGAHNPHGVEALTENLKTIFQGQKFIFITGILADKDYKQMLALTLPYALEYITVEPANTRALSAEDCAKTIRSLSPEGKELPVGAASNPETAVQMALQKQKARQKQKALQEQDSLPVPICAFGSLYNVNAIRNALLAADPH